MANIEIKEVTLSEDFLSIFRNTYKCEESQVSICLSKIAVAAMEEYLQMVFGEKNFTKASDWREYRLLLLTQNLFDGFIPDENTVALFFKITVQSARSLIRTTLAKYSYLLKEAVKSTILRTINEGIPQENGPYQLNNVSQVIIDEMNRIASSIDGSYLQISRQKGSLRVYLMPRATRTALLGWLEE